MPVQSDTNVAIFPLAVDDEARRKAAVVPDHVSSFFAKEASTPFELAECYLSVGVDAAALNALQTAISEDNEPETRARCYLRAGEIRERLGEFEPAAQCYEAAVTQDLADPKERYFAHNNLGYCLNRLGRYSEAELWCRRAIEMDAERFNAHKNLGIALERTGRFGEAAAAYQVAARAEPSDGRALRRLRILIATHPELSRDRPDLVRDAELLRQAAQHSDVPPAEIRVDAERVRALMQGIRVDEEVATDGFQVFGLVWDHPSGLDYSTLDESLAAGTLEITEVNEGGQVPTLKLSNTSDKWVLLMGSEQLIGAKQNRVLNSSIMADEHAEMSLPVTCVEQGRWAYRSRRFATSGTSSHATLRMMMGKHVHHAYQLHGQPQSDQGAVWGEVRRKLVATETRSPSHALHEAYEKHESRLREIQELVSPREGWNGALFAYGGIIVGLDLFDRPATLKKLWPKLVRAHAIDAFEKRESPAVSRSQVEEWIRGLSRSAVEGFRSPGRGTDVRLEGDRLVGAMLLVDDTPVHLEAFADDDE